MKEALLTLGIVGILGGTGYALYAILGTAAPSPAPSSSTTVVTKTVFAKSPPAPAVPAPPPAAAHVAPATPQTLQSSLVQLAGGSAVGLEKVAAAGALNVASDAVRNYQGGIPTVNIAAVANPVIDGGAGGLSGALSNLATNPSQDAAANALGEASNAALGLSQVAVDGIKSLVGLRGETVKQQIQTFGNATVKALQTTLAGVLPVVGAGIGQVLGALAGTGTGAKVVTAVGVAEEQGYNLQKDAVNSALDALSGGGSSHADRVAELLEAERETQPLVDPNDPTGNKKAEALAQSVAAGTSTDKTATTSLNQPTYAQDAAASLAGVARVQAADAAAYAAGTVTQTDIDRVQTINKLNSELAPLQSEFSSRDNALLSAEFAAARNTPWVDTSDLEAQRAALKATLGAQIATISKQLATVESGGTL